MFLYFLDKNGVLFRQGEKLIDDHTLVALTIMIAESNPDEKEMMISVIMNCMKQFYRGKRYDKNTFRVPRQDLPGTRKVLKIKHFLCSLLEFTNISGESGLQILITE